MYAFSMYSIQPLYAAIFCSQTYFCLVFTPVVEQRDIAGQNVFPIGEIRSVFRHSAWACSFELFLGQSIVSFDMTVLDPQRKFEVVIDLVIEIELCRMVVRPRIRAVTGVGITPAPRV